MESLPDDEEKQAREMTIVKILITNRGTESQLKKRLSVLMKDGGLPLTVKDYTFVRSLKQSPSCKTVIMIFFSVG